MSSDILMGTMGITTVVGCKNNCSYCPQKLFITEYAKKSYRGSIRKGVCVPKRVFSLEDFKLCLSKIPKNVRIDFAGLAEPFLNPSCAELILHAHNEGYKVSLATTMVGLTKESYQRIKAIPFKFLYIHLPDNKGRTNILVDKEYLDMLQFIIKNPITKRDCFVYYGSVQSDIKKVLKNNKLIICKMPLCSRGGNLKEYMQPDYKGKQGKHYCLSSEKLNHNDLLPSGDVIICCADYGMRHVIGNLLTGDYPSLFKSKEFLRIKKGFKDGGKGSLCYTCENCIKVYSLDNLKIKARNFVRDIREKLKKVLKKNK